MPARRAQRSAKLCEFHVKSRPAHGAKFEQGAFYPPKGKLAVLATGKTLSNGSGLRHSGLRRTTNDPREDSSRK